MKYIKCISIEIGIVCYALIHADVLNPASNTSNCYFTYLIKVPDFKTFLYDTVRLILTLTILFYSIHE